MSLFPKRKGGLSGWPQGQWYHVWELAQTCPEATPLLFAPKSLQSIRSVHDWSQGQRGPGPLLDVTQVPSQGRRHGWVPWIPQPHGPLLWEPRRAQRSHQSLRTANPVRLPLSRLCDSVGGCADTLLWLPTSRHAHLSLFCPQSLHSSPCTNSRVFHGGW